jgi:hypothetical protein
LNTLLYIPSGDIIIDPPLQIRLILGHGMCQVLIFIFIFIIIITIIIVIIGSTAQGGS